MHSSPKSRSFMICAVWNCSYWMSGVGCVDDHWMNRNVNVIVVSTIFLPRLKYCCIFAPVNSHTNNTLSLLLIPDFHSLIRLNWDIIQALWSLNLVMSATQKTRNLVVFTVTIFFPTHVSFSLCIIMIITGFSFFLWPVQKRNFLFVSFCQPLLKQLRFIFIVNKHLNI